MSMYGTFLDISQLEPIEEEHDGQVCVCPCICPFFILLCLLQSLLYYDYY